jgi:DNA-binding HxlR family transcriptional regulator
VSDSYEQGCPVAVALDLIGDRWTLLFLRDLTHAPMRFIDLQHINPKVSPNLLTKRLRSLQSAGILTQRELPPPARAVVYELDPRAREMLLPILNGLGRFGAYLFESAPTGPTDALVEQMRRNGHWVLAKGVD